MMDIDPERFQAVKLGMGSVTAAGIAGFAVRLHFINELMLFVVYGLAIYTGYKAAARASRLQPVAGQDTLRDKLTRSVLAAVRAWGSDSAVSAAGNTDPHEEDHP